MDIITAQLEVIETCSALSRPRALSVSNGVVTADLGTSYQGTGMSIAARGGAFTVPTPSVRKGVPSGTTAWSPPV